MNKAVACAALLVVGGCATAPAPNLYNGRYYMAGDKNCKFMTPISDTQIMCHDKNGNQIGYRNAMSADEMQMYAINQQVQALAISNAIAQAGQALQPQPPVVASQSLAPSGGVTYRQVGNSLIGSNGVSYRRVGNTIMGTDGSSCQIIGSMIHCR